VIKKVPQRRTEGTKNKRELTRNDTKYREGKEDVRKKQKKTKTLAKHWLLQMNIALYKVTSPDNSSNSENEVYRWNTMESRPGPVCLAMKFSSSNLVP
jgi:hypothetical protein